MGRAGGGRVPQQPEKTRAGLLPAQLSLETFEKLHFQALQAPVFNVKQLLLVFCGNKVNSAVWLW